LTPATPRSASSADTSGSPKREAGSPASTALCTLPPTPPLRQSTNPDNSLRSANYFDVDNHPTARFRSTAITMDGNGGTVTGDLAIKGVTRRVVLDVEYLGYARDPWGNDRAAFSATATINREDWGLTNNMALDSGRLLVSKRIQLEIELELIHQGEPGE